MPKYTLFPPSVYFLGIGGIGVSALAELALYRGSRVYGSDIADSQIIEKLRTKGAHVEIGASLSDFPKINLVVHTTAAASNHPILRKARSAHIPIKTYPQMLGELSKQYFTIAVSGMHGKSTTTSMIGLMLEFAGLDPLVIVGTQVREWRGNIRIPNHGTWNMERGTKKKKNIFVVEADEYKSAMLNLEPDIIVLTRVEEDHLDYFKNLEYIKREFRKYVRTVPKKGCVVANWGDGNIRSIVKLLYRYIVKYNISKDKEIKEKIKKVLRVPGEHNVENALAAYKVGERLGLKEDQILTGLSKFKGTWRRMELVGKLQIPRFQIPILSDYAHHPTEIKATLQAVREKYPKKRVVLAYQPHQHNRTKTLFNQFITAFDQADVLILNEIFDVAGREENKDQNVSSKDLLKQIEQRANKAKNCCYTTTLQETKKKILELVKPNDILVIMGAGDIDSMARELV